MSGSPINQVESGKEYVTLKVVQLTPWLYIERT